jgi:hypothetical protein
MKSFIFIVLRFVSWLKFSKSKASQYCKKTSVAGVKPAEGFIINGEVTGYADGTGVAC